MTPERLGRYEILGELGKGAMGVVFLGRDPIIGRQVALKTFRLVHSVGDEELAQFRARFLREAQSAGILSHRNIVTIHDVVEEKTTGTFFIAMEYVKGTDLKQLLQRRTRFDLPFVIDVVAQIADGLDYAHSKGVVHRDIKPANVILTADKEVKITDFGIARVDASNLTVEGQLLGTPNYMAPEQIQGKEVDHRADLFSLGVMFYEMLTGHKPFQGDNLTVVTHRIVFDAFTAPDEFIKGLPEPVLKVLEKTLAKAPDERYQSGDELARDLRQVLQPAQPSAGRSSGSFLIPEERPVAAATGSVETATPPSGTAATPPAPGPAAAPSPPAPSLPTPGAVAPASAPQGRSPGFWGLPPLRRTLWVAIGALISSAVLGGGASFVGRGEEPPAPLPDPGHELRLQYLPHLKEGVRSLRAGRPATALEALERALRIAPDNADIRRLRDRARREALPIDSAEDAATALAERLQEAGDALRQRRYEDALALAQEIQEVEPDHAEAARIASAAQEGLDRRMQVAERLSGGRRPRGGPEPPAVDPAPPPPPPAVAGTATLQIEFASEAPAGRLTIYRGQDPILQESFDFSDKRGFFGRRQPTGGSLTATETLPAGPVTLMIYVYRRDHETKSAVARGALTAGGTGTLQIRFSEEGVLTARLL